MTKGDTFHVDFTDEDAIHLVPVEGRYDGVPYTFWVSEPDANDLASLLRRIIRDAEEAKEKLNARPDTKRPG